MHKVTQIVNWFWCIFGMVLWPRYCLLRRARYMFSLIFQPSLAHIQITVTIEAAWYNCRSKWLPDACMYMHRVTEVGLRGRYRVDTCQEIKQVDTTL